MLSNYRAITLWSKFRSDEFPNKQKNSRLEWGTSERIVPEPENTQKGLLPWARQP